MVYEHEIDGLRLKTGDLICTTDGSTDDIRGQFWRIIGKLIPGKVDHVAIYIGPAGRCVEAGAKAKVSIFNVRLDKWDAASMVEERGPLIDVFYGVAYPLEGRGLISAEEARMRVEVAEYCLRQATLNKPYNLNFFDSSTEEAFYCSQLAYSAYRRVGIDLNTGLGVRGIPGTESIVFPQEIWNACIHRRP